MGLQQILYIAVFLICVAVFAKVRSRGIRQGLLVFGSYVLYLTWTPWFAAVLVVSTVCNFFLGKWLQKTPTRLVLFTGILFNLALLSTFKYLPEAAVRLPFASLQRFAHLALPLGISFWTFQAMSYLFDLYREEELDPTFLEFAAYMVFFPVTISGAICRMTDMLPQFRSAETTSLTEIGRGMTRISTGVFMMQIAKLLGQGLQTGGGISSGFDHATHWSGPDVWCLACGYGLQLFFDFAGYSHIAIGASQALGFVVPENFARPFQAVTPSVFWTRWHMSLSFWIRDYVFLPLAVMRREVAWRNLVLALSMVLFGVWHKATWLFVLWGCYHGALLVLHRQVQQVQRRFNWSPSEKIWNPLSWVVTMALVNLGWVFFRANSLEQARRMLGAVVSPASYGSHFLSAGVYGLVFAAAVAYAVALLVGDLLGKSTEEPESGSRIMVAIARHRWYWIPPLYVLGLLVLVIITSAQSASTSQAMYAGF